MKNDYIIAVRRVKSGQSVELHGTFKEAGNAFVHVTAALMQVLDASGQSEALAQAEIRSLVELGIDEYRRHRDDREPYECEVWRL